MNEFNKKRLQKLSGLLKEQDDQIEIGISPPSDRQKQYDIEKSIGLTETGFYWFRNFREERFGRDEWQVVHYEAGTDTSFSVDFMGSDEGYAIFHGTKEEYMNLKYQPREILGEFVGPLRPPK